jgi:hypothetical protein
MKTKKREARIEKREAAAVRGRQRRGFAFTEVLFAVMVLGIGFIMIAAMFPVTIRQTQNTMADVVGANEAKAAIAYMQTIASDANFPVTVPNFPPGKPDPSKPSQLFSLQDAPYLPTSVTPAPPNGYMSIRGNFVNPNNPRIAWLPVYRRGVRLNGKNAAGDPNVVGDPFAQVFVFAIQSRNRTQYYPWPDPGRPYSDFDVPPNPAPGEVSTLSPRSLQVVVKYNISTLRGELTIPDALARQWAAPGAYVIIANDLNANAPLNTPGQSNGRVYQLSSLVNAATGTWDLMPGSDMIRKSNTGTPIVGDDNDLPATPPTTAYMIGRGYSNPLDATEGYAGATQDIAVYTGYIQIPPEIHP